MFKRTFRVMAKNQIWFVLAALVVAIIFPFAFKSAYILRVATSSLMYVMLAVSLNFLTGTMGQMYFGHAAFFGIGAYTAAILSTRLGFNSEVTWILAAVIAGFFGLVLGLPVLKLKGYYLAIVTMGFCEIVRLIEANWMSLTRGPLGIMNIPYPSFFGIKVTTGIGFYFLILIMVIVTTYIIKSLIDSRIGTTLLAIRDDELAAASMGVNVFKYKVMAFIITAMFAGIAGAFYAQYISFVDPSSFSVDHSQQMTVMVILGGLGSIVGSFLGAIALVVLPETLRSLMQYRMLLYGGLLVLMMLVKPEGLLGHVNFKYLRQQINFEKEQKLLCDEKAGSNDG